MQLAVQFSVEQFKGQGRKVLHRRVNNAQHAKM